MEKNEKIQRNELKDMTVVKGKGKTKNKQGNRKKNNHKNFENQSNNIKQNYNSQNTNKQVVNNKSKENGQNVNKNDGENKKNENIIINNSTKENIIKRNNQNKDYNQDTIEIRNQSYKKNNLIITKQNTDKSSQENNNQNINKDFGERNNQNINKKSQGNNNHNANKKSQGNNNINKSDKVNKNKNVNKNLKKSNNQNVNNKSQGNNNHNINKSSKIEKKQDFNKTENTSKKAIPTKTEQKDTSGDTKIFQIVKKEDINKQKEIQAIQKENYKENQTENKTKNKNNPKLNDYQKNNTNVKLNNYEEKDKQVHKKKRAPLIILLIILIIALILITVPTIFGFVMKSNDKIIKGVYINNIEVSGLTKEAAIIKVNNELNSEENNFIIVTHGDYSKEIHLSNIGGRFNTEECVDTAYNLARSNNILSDDYKIIDTIISKNNISASFTYNDELLNKTINEIATEIPDLATESSYIIDQNKIIIKNSKDGVQIKSGEFKQKVVDAFTTEQNSIEIPVEPVQRKEIDIEQIHKDIYKEAKNAYYTTNPRKVYKEEYGIDFAISMEQAKQMLSEDKEQYEIKLKEVRPKITVADLDSAAYPDLLSTFTTYYGTADTGRNTNIALAAKSINSVVLMPGETFSFNNLIGECSARTGYKESTVYENGQVAKGIGGGICQVSSTLYNAVLRSNLEIVERRNHGLGVTYVPAGLDATVAIGYIDFKFKNNRDYPVKVVAYVGTGNITCEIYGLKQDKEYEVKLVPTTIEDTGTKYKVQTYKILYLDGKEVSRTLISTDTYKRH